MQILEIGTIITGKVTEIAPYGAFIECENGQKGLLHISEVSHDYVTDINDVIKIGDLLKLKILAIDPNNLYLRLSLKQCNPPIKRHEKKAIRVKIPETDINFNNLKNALPIWIETALQKNEE
jgi:predicted RNA-binding protein with RPS1 domain